jgi:ellis van creveld syndrome protein 1
VKLFDHCVLHLQLKQIADEERRLEVQREQELQDLRDRLSAETTAALDEQERQLGLLIARLQVGQARRLAIIEKQDKTIKELEDQLANRLGNEEPDEGVDEVDAEPKSNEMVDAILQQHQNQVEQLQDRMDEVKERQEQMLKEKLQAKQLKKQRCSKPRPSALAMFHESLFKQGG